MVLLTSHCVFLSNLKEGKEDDMTEWHEGNVSANQNSLGIRRTRLLTSTAWPLMLLLIMQSVLSACSANTPTVQHSAPSSYGCTSPSDCVSKMTLPEKEGQMTQAENNAFTMPGNSISDITTYFIGSVLSGGGGGPQGSSGGTATQWADMVANFKNYAL